MECRIDVAHQPGCCVVHVTGRLTDVQVPDLLKVCATLHMLVRIDLAELDSANRIGLEALNRLRNDGAEIVGAPRHIELLLDALRAGR